MECQVTLRIVLLKPPIGVLYCLQDDNGRFVSTTMSTGMILFLNFRLLLSNPTNELKNQISLVLSPGVLPASDSFILTSVSRQAKKIRHGKDGPKYGSMVGQSMSSLHQKKSLGRWCMKSPLIRAKC